MRRSKIVCTLGPATSSEEKIRELIAAGMDVVRINCSHGTLDEHGERIATVRRVAQEFDKPVAILVDLQGPKIRLAQFANGSEILEVGQSFTSTTREVTGDATIVGTTFKGLPGDCQVGDTLLVDDGNIKLRVTQVSETDVTTEVVVGGRVSDHKGLNLPGAAVSVPALSEKDQQDLRWAMTQPIDYVALSFVRTATDVQDVYNLMDECGGRLPVLAKIEKPQAVDNLVDIIENCDGIMVARGDLGVEMALEMVPVVQKRVIQECRFRGKPVIVATQVLESMITHARPTRAEASDCANAIWDGADAVMMSGETAVGQYPIEAVQTMSDIIEAAEERGYGEIAPLQEGGTDQSAIITEAATWIAGHMDAKAVVCFTDSGMTARRLSRGRTHRPLYAFSYSEETRRRLALIWGIHAYQVELGPYLDVMIPHAEKKLLELRVVERGDKVVFVGGMPPGERGNTNSIRVHRIGSTTDIFVAS